MQTLASLYMSRDHTLTIDLVRDLRNKTSTTVLHLAVPSLSPTVLPSLVSHFHRANPCLKTLVFTRTKREAEELSYEQISAGVRLECMHGDKTQ